MVVYCRAAAAAAAGDLPTLRGSRVNAVWFNAACAVHAKRRDDSSLAFAFIQLEWLFPLCTRDAQFLSRIMKARFLKSKCFKSVTMHRVSVCVCVAIN